MNPERAHFDRCWPWLDAALDAYPIRTHDKEDVWALIESGRAMLWPGPTAAFVTERKVYPKATVLHVWLAGGDLAGIRDVAALIEAYAKAVGYTASTIAGRKGWLRTLDGWREGASLLMKDLEA